MAITRRTRNAFVGLSRHKGSNPLSPLFNQEETTAELTKEILQRPLFVLEDRLFDIFIGFFLWFNRAIYICVFLPVRDII